MSKYINSEDIYAKKAGDDDDWETCVAPRVRAFVFSLTRLSAGTGTL